MPVQTAIQVRRGTASSWTSTNPTLAAGEIGFETDTNRFKIGTGSTAWNSLSYFVQDPVTTKGDLYTFSTTDARLPVGANGDTLVADSSQTTGLRWGNNYGFTAGKNKLINGDFRINQRSFSSTTSDATYTFDRWITQCSASQTYSAQTFTAGTAPVAGYEGVNYLRVVTTAGTNLFAYIIQRIEDVRTFAGQTFTLSFWAKANSGTPNIIVRPAQNFGSGGSATVEDIGSVVTISTSWARYSLTFTMPSIAGKTIGTGSFLGIPIGFNNFFDGRVGQQSNTFEIWGVQAEAGSVATAFQTATGTLAGELAACQRYYQRFTAATDEFIGSMGIAYLTTAAIQIFRPYVKFRVEPTVLEYANCGLGDGVAGNSATATLSFWGINSNDGIGVLFQGATGLTQYRNYFGYGNGGNAYVGMGAEL